jgi:hypothetical protein
MRGKGVVSIKDLFAAYQNRFSAPQKTVVDAFVRMVKSVCGIDIPTHAVQYAPQGRTITLHLPGQVKSEILLKKPALLETLRKELGEKNAPTQVL